MHLQEIIDMDKKYYMNTFGDRTPVCFAYGKGMNLWDTEGNKYTDFYAGIAVNALGYAHPALVEAIKSQAEKLIHCSNIYYVEAQALLVKLLVENSCADRIFLANSGAEANEGAIKLAKIFFKKKNLPEKYEIITLTKSFHGRTLTTLAATGQEKFHKPYTPLIPGFKYAPLNDIEALREMISDATCAVMMEPIQGESGVNLADMEYVKAVRKLCDDKGILLIFDEIQTGMGRTGKLFAYQQYGVEPDIFTLAKGLAGGVPIGAVCAREDVAKAFEPGDHGSTFGGNPLASAAGVAVMETMLKDGLPQNAEKMGSYIKIKLQGLSEKFNMISEIRGMGLMIGIQLTSPKAVEIRLKLMNKGFLVGNVGDSILRLLPPLIVGKQNIDMLLEAFESVLSEY